MYIVTSFFRNKIFFFSIVVLAVLSQFALAQSSGIIKGHILDRESGEPLIGSNAIVVNTSLGAAADIDGRFILYHVPAGEQTIRISYIGYSSVDIKVDVKPDETVEQEFRLSVQAIVGETVTVTAQAKGQMNAINQQLSSNKIVNMVSEDKIKELPDANAAEAIGRLPGISTLRSSGEANKIVIRGLAPQYNLVAVNDITMAGTSKYDRSIDLTMITPLMLKSVEVSKSLTPDMEANAIGGSVNMQLREAPSGFHSDLMWQSGYTAKNNIYSNYKAYGAVSDRFFDDKLGVYFLLSGEKYNRDADNMSANMRVMSENLQGGIAPIMITDATLNRHFEKRSRYGANLILDYKLTNGSIQIINMFSRLNSDYNDYRTKYNYDGHSLEMNYQDGVSKTDQLIDALQGKYDFGFIAMDLSVANTYSRNYNPFVPNYTWGEGGANDSTYGVIGILGVIPLNTPPDKLFRLAGFVPQRAYIDQLGYNTYDYKENDQTVSANFKIPYNLMSTFISGSFKFGGKYRYYHRINNENAPYLQIRYQGSDVVRQLQSAFPDIVYDYSKQGFGAYNFTDNDPKIMSTFLDGKFGSLFWAPKVDLPTAMLNYVRANCTNAVNWHDGPYEDLINDYHNVERYSAGYLMTEINVGSDLLIVGGARYEKDVMEFTAYKIKQPVNTQQAMSVATPVTSEPSNEYWLPMVQLKYSPLSWVDIRFAYSKTLARPNFDQLSPYENSDINGAYINAGNPKLLPAVSNNRDVMLTLHGDEFGLLSIGVFSKTISNFSYWIQYSLYENSTVPGFDTLAQHPFAGPSAKLSTFNNNPYNATVEGIEVDYQTRLWFAPAPLNGIVLGLNYTRIKSNTKYPMILNSRKMVLQPNGRYRAIDFIYDSTRAGRLINQPNDIVNAAVGYDYKGFSGRVSFVFQGNAVSGIGIRDEQDSFTKDYFRIDASLKQTLPIEGLELFLNINNINERADISAQKTIGASTSQQFYGLTADLGIRYSF
jgi:TonB-dependent receptor